MAFMRSPVRSRSGPPSFANPKADYYIGLTHDARARLADHNPGRRPHTARYRPWYLHVTIELPDEQRAIQFEQYLKSGFDRAAGGGRDHVDPQWTNARNGKSWG